VVSLRSILLQDPFHLESANTSVLSRHIFEEYVIVPNLKKKLFVLLVYITNLTPTVARDTGM